MTYNESRRAYLSNPNISDPAKQRMSALKRVFLGIGLLVGAGAVAGAIGIAPVAATPTA